MYKITSKLDYIVCNSNIRYELCYLNSYVYTEIFFIKVQCLQKLEAENQECCKLLRETISRGG